MENKTKNHNSERANKKGQVSRLATILGMGGLNGSVSIAASTGLFKIQNAFVLAIIFIAGPGAIITALTFDGIMKERMLAALLASLIATIIVVFAAGIGAKAFSFLNINVLRFMGGIAVLTIGLIIMGFRINEKVPLWIIVIGLIIAGVWK